MEGDKIPSMLRTALETSSEKRLMRDHSNKDENTNTPEHREEGCSTYQQMANQSFPTSDSHGQVSDVKHVMTHSLSSSLLLQQQTYLSHMGQQSLMKITGGMISTNTGNTVITSIHQFPYGYNSSNLNVDGSGGYQHGVTGTNNSAPSQSTGHQGQGSTAASSSGMGQYQHYPYHSSDPVLDSSENVIQQHQTSTTSATVNTSTLTNGTFLSPKETHGVKKVLNQEIGERDFPKPSVSHPHITVAVAEQQQQENCPYYSEAQYGYNSSNSNMDGSGGYQHGTTCTNNSALSQSTGHQQDPGLSAASSGIGQYQQYPYNSDSSHSPSNLQSVPTSVIAPLPVGVVPANTVDGKTTATASYSNLEVLTILDTSEPASTAEALPETQLSEAIHSSVNERETTTLTKSTTKSLSISPSSTDINSATNTECYELLTNDLFSDEGALEESPNKKVKLSK